MQGQRRVLGILPDMDAQCGRNSKRRGHTKFCRMHKCKKFEHVIRDQIIRPQTVACVRCVTNDDGTFVKNSQDSGISDGRKQIWQVGDVGKKIITEQESFVLE